MRSVNMKLGHWCKDHNQQAVWNSINLWGFVDTSTTPKYRSLLRDRDTLNFAKVCSHLVCSAMQCSVPHHVSNIPTLAAMFPDHWGPLANGSRVVSGPGPIGQQWSVYSCTAECVTSRYIPDNFTVWRNVYSRFSIHWHQLRLGHGAGIKWSQECVSNMSWGRQLCNYSSVAGQLIISCFLLRTAATLICRNVDCRLYRL